MNARHLKRRALDAHHRGDRWDTFWREHAEAIRQAEPYHVSEPWEANDRPEQTKPADVGTAARIDWQAAGVAISTATTY